MTTPFDKLPLNYLRQFVQCTDKSGCDIYIPVNSQEQSVQNAKKAELQKFLDNQPAPPAPSTPPKRYA